MRNKIIILLTLVGVYAFTLVSGNDLPIARIEVPSLFGNKSFYDFKEALAQRESGGRYDAVNSLGYLGKYQFGKTTLQHFGIKNSRQFLNSPSLQEAAFVALCAANKYTLQKEIKKHEGKRVKGVKITESGILAAAHLAGAGNVRRYLRTYGSRNTKDAYGSSIRDYMREFGGYNTSKIVANKRATLPVR